LRENVEPVAEREESVRGDHRARERMLRVLRLELGDARSVDAAHLARADAERAAVLAENDGVGLYVPGDAPREQQVIDLTWAGLRAGDGPQLGGLDAAVVGRLDEKPAADALEVMGLRGARERDRENTHVGLRGEGLAGRGV